MSDAAENVFDEVIDLLKAGKSVEAVEKLRSLPSHTIVEFLLRMSEDERKEVLKKIDLSLIMEEFSKLPAGIIWEVFEVRRLEELLSLFGALPVDELADIVLKLPPGRRLEFLKKLPREIADTVARLAKFPPESVGGVMTTMVPVFKADMSVEKVIEEYIEASRTGKYEVGHIIYAVDDDGRLIGQIDLKTLLLKPRNLPLAKCITPVKATVTPFHDREEAARLAIEYDMLEVPVVDFDNRLIGVVTLDDLLDVLVSEYSEDLLKYAGFTEAVKASYVAETPIRLALKRVPVIIYLYLMDSITGSIVAGFTNVIERAAVLAAFMPMLADNSGNIGSQASALILRGLVTGELKLTRRDLSSIIIKEFKTTTLMLAMLVPVALGIAMLITYISTGNIWDAARISTIVTSALAVSCYVADLFGALLPVLLAKFGIDPASASAPVITSIADIATVTVYFLLATILMGAT